MTHHSAIPRLAGPWPLGHMREFRDDRIGLLLRLARSHPDVAQVWLGTFGLVVTSCPELIHSLLVQHTDDLHKDLALSVFAAPVLGEGLLLLEGDAHRKRRRMLAPNFMPKRIVTYAEQMAVRAERRAIDMCAQRDVDIAEQSARVTLEIVGKTLFDAEVGDDAAVIGGALTEAMDCIIDSMTRYIPMPPAIPTATNRRLRRAVHRLDQVLYRMIAERRRAGDDRGDLLSVLLRARDADDGSALDDRGVRDEAMTLLLAGHETTANALAWTLYLLGTHPHARERLEAEVDAAARVRNGPRFGAADLNRLPYTLQVVKEAMRLYPPAYIVGRRVERGFEACGYRFRRGQLVLANIVGLHRRADLYPDPERFDPERFSPTGERARPRQAFMPFGAGARVCIGSHFALMEAQLILATWIHAARFEPASDAPPDLQALITLRPAGGIRMRVTPRNR